MICEACDQEFTHDASSPVGLCPSCWDDYRRECIQCGAEWNSEEFESGTGLCETCFKNQPDPVEEFHEAPEGHGESYYEWKHRRAAYLRAERSEN